MNPENSEQVPAWVKELVAQEIREEEEDRLHDAMSVLEELIRWADRRDRREHPWEGGDPWWVTKAREILKREYPWRS